MTTIAAVRSALPEHSYPQQAITLAFGDMVLAGDDAARPLLGRLHAACGVATRHLALPLEAYPELSGFGAANDVFIDVGSRLAAKAVDEALATAGLRGEDVDLVMSASVTGIAAPSLEVRLVPRLGLRPDVKRVPIFGLGCVAGAAGVARVHDYLAGHPDGVAVLVCVEICSLTVQREDSSMANLVASGLFGDGAAAVVMVGSRRARELGIVGPVVRATRSRLYPDSERVMGWDIGGSGFRIVLAATVADVIEKYLADDVEAFLAEAGLGIDDVATWVAHPGGPKVIDAIIRALGLPDTALDVTRASLSDVGNLSSVSVLQVLERTLALGIPVPGTPGLMLAMGPGFCSELVLLTW